jgi:hypothetical protein
MTGVTSIELAEQIGVAVLVAGGEQLLQLQLLEVVREVVKEIANLGIVAVAQDGLALEMLRVMPQLLLDVGDLGVKLILLGRLRRVQASIERLAFHVVGLVRHWSKNYPPVARLPVERTLYIDAVGLGEALSSESSHDVRPAASRKPVLDPGKQFRRICARAEPRDQEKGRGLVCIE